MIKENTQAICMSSQFENTTFSSILRLDLGMIAAALRLSHVSLVRVQNQPTNHLF